MLKQFIAITITFCCVTTSNYAIAKSSLTSQQIATKSMPSIVTIKTFDSNNNEFSLGTGFAITANGIILTNNHVIKDSNKIIVTDYNGITYDNVSVLGRDEERDVALLRALNSNLSHLTISESAKARQGDKVYAIGNPMGYERTFSDGIISSIRMIDNIKMIQFTAPISSGSSGGPLLNDSGKVIGITTMTHTKGQNINIAISSQEFNKLIKKTNTARKDNKLREEYFQRSNVNVPIEQDNIDAILSDKSVWENFDWSDINKHKIYSLITSEPSYAKCTKVQMDSLLNVLNEYPSKKDILPVNINCANYKLFDVDTQVIIQNYPEYDHLVINLDNTFSDSNRVINWANKNFGKSVTKMTTHKIGNTVYSEGYAHNYLTNNTVITVDIADGIIMINFIKRKNNEVVKPDIFMTCSIATKSRKYGELQLDLEFLLDQESSIVRKHDGTMQNADVKYTTKTITITEYSDSKKENVRSNYTIDRLTGKISVHLPGSSKEILGNCVDSSKIKALF